MTRPGTRFVGWLVAAALVGVPLVYLPDGFPPILGWRWFPVALPFAFDFTLLPRLILLQALLLAAVLVRAFAAWQARDECCHRPTLALPALAYLAVSTLSALWAGNAVEALWQCNVLLTMGLLFAVVGFAVPGEMLLKLVRIAAGTGAVVAGIGIMQYFGWAYSEIPTVGNPSATFGYRNFAASYTVALIPAAAALALVAAGRFRTIAWSASFALMLLFVIYTRTRGAWLGLGAASAVALGAAGWLRIRSGIRFPTLRWGRSLILCTGLAAALAAGALPHRMAREGKFPFDERKADALTTLGKTFSPADARGRLTVWAHTAQMVKDHPLFGVGLGGWQFAYPAYDRGDWISDVAAPQRPHNDLLWILSETGMPGLAAYLWLLAAAAAVTWRAVRRAADETVTLVLAGVAVGVLALVGHSLVSFPRERIGPSMVLWFGLAVVSRLGDRGAPGRPVRSRWWRLPLILSAVTLALGLWVTRRRLGFDEHYLNALTAWRAGQWERVSAEADRALDWGVLNHRALLLKGLADQQLGRRDEAVAAYERALRYHPNEGHGALAAAYAGQGRYEQAQRHFRAELDLFPRSRQAALGLASALQHLGRSAEAAAAYRKALAAGPTDPDVLNSLGAALQASGDLHGALRCFRQARDLDPTDARTCNNLGAALAALGRHAEAEAAYRQALDLDPGYARVYHNLGDLYAGVGQDSLAAEAYRTFLEQWRGDPRFLDLARRKLRRIKEGR